MKEGENNIMSKQHDYEVTLLFTLTVYNATSKEVSIEGAKSLIKDEPEEYVQEAEVIKVQDLGISKIQLS